MAWKDAPRIVTAGLIVAAWAACLALNWPGHLSYDSVVQLAEGRAGAYTGEHPPVMSWLLGLGDALRPGAALFIVFDATLIYGALLALAVVGQRTSWLAAPVAAALAFTPQLAVYPAIVWKDVLFAGAALGGFACLAWAGARWARPRWRWLLVAKSLALVTLAALARQNGAVVLPFAALALGWIAARSGAGPIARWAYGGGYLAAGAALALGAAAALETRVEDPGGLAQAWQALQTYDIVGAAVREPHIELAVLHARAPWAETLARTEGAAAWTPAKVDSLAPVMDRMAARGDVSGPIADQWRELILRHPLTYLRGRAEAFEWVFLTPQPYACGLVFTGVDGPAEEMAGAGLTPRKSPRDKALADYAVAFAGTPVFSHAAFGAVGLALLVALLVRRRPADLAVAGLLASALAFTATFWVISIACDYRYLYALDLGVIAAMLYAAASFPAWFETRPRGRSSP